MVRYNMHINLETSSNCDELYSTDVECIPIFRSEGLSDLGPSNGYYQDCTIYAYWCHEYSCHEYSCMSIYEATESFANH